MGGAFTLSARLLAAESGATLVSLQETARDSADLIAGVGRLARKIRERVGDQLREALKVKNIGIGIYDEKERKYHANALCLS